LSIFNTHSTKDSFLKEYLYIDANLDFYEYHFNTTSI